MHFRLYLETYNYTLYDVLQKIQRVKKQSTNLHVNSDLFTLPTSGDFFDALQEVAPQFTFTQMSVYEALDQVAKYLDGVITLSSTNVLGIEYFNNLSGATAFTSGKADQTSTISEDTYINGLISNYQNARAKEPVWYPSQNGYEISKSSVLGIATTPTRVAHTSEPIESIEKFIVLVSFQSTVIGASLDFTDIEVDMTDYVVEKSIYDILPSTTDEFYNGDSSIKTNYNTVFYEKGGNDVKIGLAVDSVNGTTYNLPRAIKAAIREQYACGITTGFVTLGETDENTILKLQYRILYRPSFNGRLKIEGQENKYNGDMLIDQSGGKIDLSKLGNSMFGLAVKLGQESKTITQEFKTFETRARKGNVYTDAVGGKWFANKVKTTIFPSYVSCEIEFSKNFNKLSQYIQVNQAKRFYAISDELTTIAEDNYCEYVYVGKGEGQDYTGESQNTACNAILLPYLKENFKVSAVSNVIDFARFKSWTDYVGGVATAISTELNIPLIMFGTGNSLVYKVGFDSSISGGSKVSAISPYVSSIVKYTDSDGFFEIADIDFRRMKITSIANQKLFATELPTIAADILNSTNSEALIDIDMLRVYKDPNEVFKLNYQLTFLPYQINEVFIGRRFVEYNALQNHFHKNTIKFFYSSTEQYSLLDTKALGTSTDDYCDVVTNSGEDGYSQTFTVKKVSDNQNRLIGPYVSWCIADEFDNILIAFNKVAVPIHAVEYAIFTIFTRHTRI
jgi:hypothetical protein